MRELLRTLKDEEWIFGLVFSIDIVYQLMRCKIRTLDGWVSRTAATSELCPPEDELDKFIVLELNFKSQSLFQRQKYPAEVFLQNWSENNIGVIFFKTLFSILETIQ